MTHEQFYSFLKINDACDPGLEWAKGKTLEEIWQTCERGDWMLWLAKLVGVDRRTLVGAATECAALVEHLLEDERSLAVIPAGRAYYKGEIGEEEMREVAAAAAAAYAAAAATYSAAAAAAAYAAAATTYSADPAATYSALALYRAEGVPESDTLRKCAEIVRKFISVEKISEGIAQKIKA